MNQITHDKSLDGIQRAGTIDGKIIRTSRPSRSRPRDFNFYSVASAQTLTSTRISRNRFHREKQDRHELFVSRFQTVRTRARRVLGRQLPDMVQYIAFLVAIALMTMYLVAVIYGVYR